MPQTGRRQFLATSLAAGASAATAYQIGSSSAAAADDVSQLGKTPHTKFAVNVEMWWTKLPFLERIEQAAALGFPAIEFWPYENKDLEAMAISSGV